MRWLAGLFSAAVILGLFALAALVGAYNYYSRDLPDYGFLEKYQPSTVTRLHAGDGRLLAEYAEEKRIFVPILAIPPLVRQAFLSAEDKGFYAHSGIDVFGIINAVFINLENLGQDRRPVGASTITQQVAKNFLLTNEVSIARKIREAILATRLERALDKDRILELYLNEIFLGFRSYGVAAAAQNYFNKSLDQLTLAEAAFLAALPKAPNNYHPIEKYSAAIARRNWVIERMREDGVINKEQAEAAKAEKIIVRRPAAEEVVRADYFAEEVRRELVEKYGQETVLKSGLTVHTSLDPNLQDLAIKALRNGLQNYDRRRGYRGPVARLKGDNHKAFADIAAPRGSEGWELALVKSIKDAQADILTASGEVGLINKTDAEFAVKSKHGLNVGDVILVERVQKTEADDKTKSDVRRFAIRQVPLVQGAIVAMNPHTGRVVAMQGGFSSQISVFNRATQAWRQPGSAFKPFVYLAALDSGFTPASIVLDAPFAIEQGPGLPVWRPENYSDEFYGPTPIRVGLEKSRNVMTVRLAHHIGMPIVVDYAKRFGIVDDMPSFLSFALGAKETTLLRLTNAYAMLANGGQRITPSFIEYVQDSQGRVVWRNEKRKCDSCSQQVWQQNMTPPVIASNLEQIGDPRTTYQMVSMLQGVVQRGTATRLNALGFPVAGKTGTTNNSMDVWFVGFTPDLAVGVFVGFDEPRSLGAKETGGSVAVPIFGEFMAGAMAGVPAQSFRVPAGLRMMRIDHNSGKPAEPSDANAIWEAFIPGTEPTDAETVLDGADGVDSTVLGDGLMPATEGQDFEQNLQGTGGLD